MWRKEGLEERPMEKTRWQNRVSGRGEKWSQRGKAVTGMGVGDESAVWVSRAVLLSLGAQATTCLSCPTRHCSKCLQMTVLMSLSVKWQQKP